MLGVEPSTDRWAMSSILIEIFSWSISLLFLFFVIQFPVTFGVSAYEAVNLYKGKRVIASKGEDGTNWKVHQLVLYCSCGILAGVVGGLLGLGGGFILGPLFLELGIPPQVHLMFLQLSVTFMLGRKFVFWCTPSLIPLEADNEVKESSQEPCSYLLLGKPKFKIPLPNCCLSNYQNIGEKKEVRKQTIFFLKKLKKNLLSCDDKTFNPTKFPCLH